MTNSIPQAAIDAALKRYQYPSGKVEDSTADHEERLTAALEAAMPYIRKQIAEEIRAGWVELDEVWAEAVKAYHADGYTQPPDDYDRMFWDAGLADAVRIVEGDQ